MIAMYVNAYGQHCTGMLPIGTSVSQPGGNCLFRGKLVSIIEDKGCLPAAVEKLLSQSINQDINYLAFVFSVSS